MIQPSLVVLMIKNCLTVCFLLVALLVHAQRPKIGVTLSGGGAKGLAHIGILKAIDSAGLEVDYVTGTSMGAIIGGLYAAGYSADSIEKIARSTDWDMLLSNSASLRSLSMNEKDEYSKYAVELPWENKGFRLPSGVIESEELWLTFSQYFFPVSRIKDFTKFPRSFKCIGTDIATGEAVILDSGEIISAVRSSMAIPSFFTAVNYQGRKLVDGGVVRNFPVSDAKKMGADFVIGSNVSSGLLPKDKINNVFQVMMQVAFFREDESAAREKKLCDIYISQPLNDYTMGSFGSADSIIAEGILKGDSLYHIFKRLADSLDAIYGPVNKRTDLVPKLDSIKITGYAVAGLKKTNGDFFKHRMQFESNRWYTSRTLHNGIRRAFGTRYYNRIIYSLQPLTDSTCNILFEVEENPLTFLKAGINYNSFTGISLIGNITARDFLTPYSRALVTVNFGERMRIRSEYLQNFGRNKTFSIAVAVQAESLKFNTYDGFNKDGVYRRNNFFADANARFTLYRKHLFSIGTRFESYNYNPEINSKLDFSGKNSLFNTYFAYRHNALNKAIYPDHGLKLDLELGYAYNQQPDLIYYTDGNEITNTDSLGYAFGNFTRAWFNMEHYAELGKKTTLITQVQAGLNFNKQDNNLNDFFIGGLTSTFRNQVTFAGLAEGTVLSPSVAAVLLGLRYQVFNNLYLTGRINGLYYNFIGSNRNEGNPDFLSGYALTLGYNFILGPLEISAMFCDQSKKVLPYINLGIPF